MPKNNHQTPQEEDLFYIDTDDLYEYDLAEEYDEESNFNEYNYEPEPPRERRGERKKAKKASTVKTFFKRLCLCLTSFLLIFVITFFSAAAVINYGPSPTVRNLFVISVMETSAAKFLATLYFSDEEIQEILDQNAVKTSDEITNADLIEIPKDSQPEFDKTKVELVDVTGSTFKGKMLIVNDPSKVYVATPPAFDTSAGGMRVEDMVKRDNALAGVNGGGFADDGGVGNGGKPLGIVISGGKLLHGEKSRTYEIIGFDKNNKLVVGNMTGQKALDMGIRDAVNFGPILIVNGEPSQVSGSGSGLNPRTAIGQRADGAVLILVIDGRQAHSLGATYKDLIDVMTEFGAVNAANLDGGSSSLMVYENEIITTCASLYGSRRIPTAFLVKREGE